MTKQRVMVGKQTWLSEEVNDDEELKSDLFLDLKKNCSKEKVLFFDLQKVKSSCITIDDKI